MIIMSQTAFLCIITPVFDPAYESLCKLTAELESQTFDNFFQVMVSNGPSPRIKELVYNLNKKDPRFIYLEMEEEGIHSFNELMGNLGKRREYCLKKYDAERYLFLDADVKLIDNYYFSKLYYAHKEIKRDVLITLVKMYQKSKEIILPILPIKFAHIDIANYCFTKKIAKSYHYPTDFDPDIGLGNDYRFFSQFFNEDNSAILHFISAIRDGNNSYKRITELYLDEEKKQK